MGIMRTVVIGDGERGLLYRNQRFERVLKPGVTRLFRPFEALDVRICDQSQLEYTGRDAALLVETLGERLPETFVHADIQSHEVGFLYLNGQLEAVLPPGASKLYWRGPTAIEIRRLSLISSLEVPLPLVERLRQIGLLAQVAVSVEVPMAAIGRLTINGKLARELPPGRYAFWNFQKHVAATVVLSGEVREEPHGVVPAEKPAQATIIDHREDAHGMRLQLNTTKRTDEKPTRMRRLTGLKPTDRATAANR